MLFYHFDSFCKGALLLVLFVLMCTGYSYRVNARRAADDPKKRDLPLSAVLLVPFTWPALLVGAISIFIIRAIAYGLFLILFMIALVLIRKPFLLIWLKKTATWVGDGLLEANTFLIQMAFGARSKKTQAT